MAGWAGAAAVDARFVDVLNVVEAMAGWTRTAAVDPCLVAVLYAVRAAAAFADGVYAHSVAAVCRHNARFFIVTGWAVTPTTIGACLSAVSDTVVAVMRAAVIGAHKTLAVIVEQALTLSAARTLPATAIHVGLEAVPQAIAAARFRALATVADSVRAVRIADAALTCRARSANTTTAVDATLVAVHDSVGAFGQAGAIDANPARAVVGPTARTAIVWVAPTVIVRITRNVASLGPTATRVGTRGVAAAPQRAPKNSHYQ